MRDAWGSGDPYDAYMGRWSRRVAHAFLDWLSPPRGLRWLDVGCGSGALGQDILSTRDPRGLTALDRSEGFVMSAQARLGSRASCAVGSAIALPLTDSAFDVTVSGLVLNFVSDPGAAVSEMTRVTTADGTVAAYVWDYAGRMDFLRIFWDAAVALTPRAESLHEGRRFPDTNPGKLRELFASASLTHVDTVPLEIETRFESFGDFWQPFLGGQGPGPTFVLSLSETEQRRLMAGLKARLPVQGDGSIPLTARAWAIRGRREA